MKSEIFAEAPDSVERLQITIRKNDLTEENWREVKGLLDNLRKQGVRLDAFVVKAQFPIK